MATPALFIQTATITTSLVSAGGIASLSLFDIPELRSQPASRSLPGIRWLFSRGSHIFPTTSFLAAAGFTYLAISVHPGSASQILRLAANSQKVNLYLAAAAINAGNFFWTPLAMIPTNFALIELNEKIGGTRSARAASEKSYGPGDRDAAASVSSKGDSTSEFKDLTGPQTQSDRKSTPEEDKKADELLAKFGALNAVRSLFPGVGGVVGLVAALI